MFTSLPTGKIRRFCEALLGLAALAGLLSSSIPTKAAPVKQVAQSSGASTTYYWYTCNSIVDVAVFTTRVNVRCATTTAINGGPVLPGIYWFAISTFDSTAASRFLSLFQTAMLSGKTLDMYLDPTDTSGDAWGCNTSDCRPLNGARVQ